MAGGQPHETNNNGRHIEQLSFLQSLCTSQLTFRFQLTIDCNTHFHWLGRDVWLRGGPGATLLTWKTWHIQNFQIYLPVWDIQFIQFTTDLIYFCLMYSLSKQICPCRISIQHLIPLNPPPLFSPHIKTGLTYEGKSTLPYWLPNLVFSRNF
jgi:hypothetical protein